MNTAAIIGRLTKDVEVRYSQGDNPMAIASFTLAVDRIGKDKGADFITCKAFGKTAETMEKYTSKGRKIAITGHIQTGSYERQDGTKVYTTDVIVDRMDFCDYKSEDTTPDTPAIPDSIEDEIPFN